MNVFSLSSSIKGALLRLSKPTQMCTVPQVGIPLNYTDFFDGGTPAYFLRTINLGKMQPALYFLFQLSYFNLLTEQFREATELA